MLVSVYCESFREGTQVTPGEGGRGMSVGTVSVIFATFICII